MQTRLSRVAAWLITLLLLVTLAAVIVWTAASEPVTLSLPTPAPVVQVTRTPAAATAAAAAPATLPAAATIGTLEPGPTASEEPSPTTAATATTAATETATATATATAAVTSTETTTATAAAAATGVVTATTAAPATAAVTATVSVTATATLTQAAAPAAATLTPTPSPTATLPAAPTVTAAAPPTTATSEAAEQGSAAGAVEDSDVISTVQIIELPVPTPTPGLAAGEWTSLTDPNQMNGLVVISNTIWIAGSGGALAWSKGSTTPVIYTAADGLAGNRLDAVANCALPGFGVVFGGPTGLQIGEARTGRWRQMDSRSSGLRYDDVSTLYCDAENGYVIVGYAAHGIDIYDAGSDEWRHVDRNSGLAANDVHSIAVVGDREQIWVASDDGVTVSAGSDSAFYDSSNSPLVAGSVGALAAAADGTVWVGGDGALYRVEDEEWTTYGADEVQGDFPDGLIVGLAFDADGSLWLGSSDAEICRFDVDAGRCADFFAGEEGMAAGPLTSLAVDANGGVYYTTAGNGYAVYNGGAWRSLAVRNPQLVGNRVAALAPAGDGSVWAATEAGVQQIAVGQSPRLLDMTDSGLNGADVAALYGAEDGLWVGGPEGGAFFDGEEWQTFTAQGGLASDRVQAITMDSQGRIWFGGDRGISIWNGSSFFIIDASQGLPSEDIRALLADEDGVWIGTAGGGLYRFEGNQLQLLNSRNVGLPSDNITALAAGGNGALWIGTDRGLAQLADGAVTPVDAVNEDAIRALAVTAGGDVWAGRADGGVFCGSGDRWTELRPRDGLPAAAINAIVADGDQVWLGGQDGGIGVYAPAAD